jgi:hypothetical protein
MFESTLPAGTPELMRVSRFRRHLDDHVPGGRWGPASTRLSSLNPSLLMDLLRFEKDGRASELLEVVAASLRHGRSLLVHTELGRHVLPMTVLPGRRLIHTPLPPHELLESRMQDLVVIHVEPGILHAPDEGEPSLQADPALCMPLDLFTWELALRGSLGRLLPEIGGSAAYRLTPAADLRGLGLNGTLSAAVHRLRRETTNLREIASWPGFDRERAMRLLNALYLQAALIVSRGHPAATNDGWRPPDGAS